MKNKGRTIGISLFAGIVVGSVIGAVTGNLGYWVAIGTVVGILIGAVLANRAALENGDGPPDGLQSDTREE